MPDTTIAPFHAARLVDEKCLVQIGVFKVDTSTHESLIESIDAIRKSNYTPQQVTGMLSVVKAQAAEMLAEEERTSLFTDVPDSGKEPLAIKIEAEGNYPLIYEALDQLASEAQSEESTAAEETAANVAKLESDLAEARQELDRLGCIGEATDDNEGLKAKVSELECQITGFQSQMAAKDLAITTLRTELAEYAGLKHDALVREAARLASELGKGTAKGKSFDAVCELLAARSDDSLKDTISDMKLEVVAAAEDKTSAQAAAPVNESAPAVADPRVPIVVTEGEELDPKDPEGAKDKLYAGIREDTQSTEIYKVCGLTEAELNEIFSKPTPKSE